ncbi:MAG: hypothetical protein NC293_04575 [Roseburia sp.]|nr:hypothetical protein [Roseburia sp.]
MKMVLTEKTNEFMNEMEWRERDRRREFSRQRQKTYFELRAEKQLRVKKFYKKLREREQLKAKKEQELLQKEIYQKGIAQLEEIRGEGEASHDVKTPRSSYILDKSYLLKILNGGV